MNIVPLMKMSPTAADGPKQNMLRLKKDTFENNLCVAVEMEEMAFGRS